jgi:hypothetical protein
MLLGLAAEAASTQELVLKNYFINVDVLMVLKPRLAA